METQNRLEELVRNLPEDLRAEVYDFVCFLLQRELREETKEWNQFSLRQALRGLEGEEELYTKDDIKVRWQ